MITCKQTVCYINRYFSNVDYFQNVISNLTETGNNSYINNNKNNNDNNNNNNFSTFIRCHSTL